MRIGHLTQICRLTKWRIIVILLEVNYHPNKIRVTARFEERSGPGKGAHMQPQAFFFVSIAFSFVAWGIVAAQIWPVLLRQPRADALRPLLTLHAFRFMGLAFLIPGVVSPNLPAGFAVAAASGDLIAAVLAWLSLLLQSSRWGIALVWLLNLWGSADILNAFFQANRAGLQAGELGGAYFVPTVIVPLLLISHVVMFALLLQPQRATAIAGNAGRA
jgi:hypothetical protein